jgi:hypothetical protein
VANDITVGEAEGKIYLLPTLIETYPIEFTANIKHTALRPSKALVTFNADNLSNIAVKVCNNFGDTTPAWVDATEQQEVELPNTAKETSDWQIGVWFYGESTGYGFVDEPIVTYLEG